MPEVKGGTYLSHDTRNTILGLHERFLHPDGPRARIAHIRLYEASTSIASAIRHGEIPPSSNLSLEH